MDAETAAVVAAVITAVAAAATGFLVSRSERKDAAREAYDQEVRARAATVFQHLFVIQHALEWITWHAVQNPKGYSESLRVDYEKDVHAAYPAVLGALAHLAALNSTLYEEVKPDSQYVYWLEGRVAQAVANTPSTDSSRELATVAEWHAECKALYVSMPLRLAEVMRAVQRADAIEEPYDHTPTHISDEAIRATLAEDRNPSGPLAMLNRRVASEITGRAVAR